MGDNHAVCDPAQNNAQFLYGIKIPANSVFRGSQESQMEAMLYQHGPISVAINGGGPLQGYTSGIIVDGCDQVGYGHAVAVVGYDNSGATPFWRLQNSYGATWGENAQGLRDYDSQGRLLQTHGYFRIAKGVGCIGIGPYSWTVDVNVVDNRTTTTTTTTTEAATQGNDSCSAPADMDFWTKVSWCWNGCYTDCSTSRRLQLAEAGEASGLRGRKLQDCTALFRSCLYD